MNENLNVAAHADTVFTRLRQARYFNGVYIIKLEKECTWHEQYAIFIINFHIGVDGTWKHRYERHEFVEDEFRDDFTKHIKGLFKGCKVNLNWNTGEVEIIGPKYQEFAKKYGDELEEFECAGSGHRVFVPNEQKESQIA